MSLFVRALGLGSRIQVSIQGNSLILGFGDSGFTVWLGTFDFGFGI